MDGNQNVNHQKGILRTGTVQHHHVAFGGGTDASDLSTLSTVYPADIESFTVLKDPAETSQYGSRGASGVIQVATKRGKGGKFHISYDGNFGFESVYKKLNMLSADEFRRQAERMGLGLVDGNQNVNHQKGILRTGTVQHHHVAFGGGTDATTE